MDTREYALHDPEGLAERIRAYRVRRGVTQRQLADELGVTQQSVARWEQGSPPRRYLVRIIESLLEEAPEPAEPDELAQIIGIRANAPRRPEPRDLDGNRKAYVQGCLKLLERGERLPNRILLLLADELGWRDED